MKILTVTLTTLMIPLVFNFSKWINHNNHNYISSDFNLKYKNEKVKILENNDLRVFIFNKSCEFKVSNGVPNEAFFYMNSNFFDKKNNPLGLVVVNGKKYSNRTDGGAYFYVLNGNPYVSRKCPYYTDYSSQSHLWVISNGYVNTSLTKTTHSKEKTYRNIVGQDKEGNIIIIVSKMNGMVTIKDLINEGKHFKMYNAVIFDGGTSVDYKFDNGDYNVSFKSLPNWIGYISGYGNPTTYISVN